MTEMSTDIPSELRIIARDAKGMDTPDRLVLFEAANLVDELYAVQSKLIESQAHRIALNERLLALIGQRHNYLFAGLSCKVVLTDWCAGGWTEVKLR